MSGKALKFLSDQMASTKEALAIVISEFANDAEVRERRRLALLALGNGLLASGSMLELD